MKNSLFVLFFVLFSFTTINSYSQSKRVTLSKQDVTLEAILEEIEEQTDYLFIYKKDVDVKVRKSINASNDLLSEVLQDLLEGSSVTYKVEGNHIILSKSGSTTTETAMVSAPQQQKFITGVVTDAKGEALIGVTAMIKGSTQGTVTDAEGKFSINGKTGDMLVVSYIGYVSQTIKIKDNRPLRITLEEDIEMLDEVVVIGYGTMQKKELTSAVSHVSSKDLLRVGNGNTAMQIQGKVPGVSIANTAAADPTSSASIQVRGVSSRSAGLGPLIVIDGIPGGDMNNVNENDIESIDVLKDGAASAIYGTRGSNGVIVITTKKGTQDGVVHTSYSGYVNIASPNRDLKVLDREQFLEHNRGIDFGSDTDWFDEITQVGFSHGHTFQISGGNSQNNYRGTVDVKDAKGVDIRSQKNEVGARLSFNHNSKNKLYSFQLNVAPRMSRIKSADYGAFWNAIMANPTMSVMDPENPTLYRTFTSYGTYNPVEALKLDDRGSERDYLEWDGTFKLNLLPLFGKKEYHVLNTQITLAQQVDNTNGFFYRPSTSTQAIAKNYKGEAERSWFKWKHESLEWLANYMFDKDNHHFKLMGGYSYQYFTEYGFDAWNKNFASDLLTYNNLGSGTYNSDEKGRLGMGSYRWDSKLIAFFGRASYNYNDKYFATLSLRYEGSSKFGPNNKWGAFPAVSAGWRISEEAFMKDITWINDLKIRGDYGVTGNQEFSNYTSIASMESYDKNYYRGETIVGWSPNSYTAPNPDVKWEKGKNWNVGIDFSLFSNRLSGSFNYYSRKQSDLLGSYNVPIPPYCAPNSFVNVGSMKNTGFEFDINWQAVKSKNFDYTFGLIGSTSNNKFISFSNEKFNGQSFYWLGSFPAVNGDPGSLQRIEEGERIGNFYTYEYAGVDEQGDWLIYNKEGEKIPISKGTDEDKKVVGNGLPKFSMSMNHSFRYKDFDLSLFFRGNFGFDIYDSHNLYYGRQACPENANVLESAYKENAHITTGENLHSSYFVHKGNFLKLDVATLGYTLKMSSKWMEKMRVYLTGRNLFTIRGYHGGLDADNYAVNGMEPGVPSSKTGYYPSSKQFLLGVQIDF